MASLQPCLAVKASDVITWIEGHEHHCVRPCMQSAQQALALHDLCELAWKGNAELSDALVCLTASCQVATSQDGIALPPRC